MTSLQKAIACSIEGVDPDVVQPIKMQADVLKAVCDHIVNALAGGYKIKEIRLGNMQWECFTEKCDKRNIKGTRIVHLTTRASAFEVIR